MVLSFKKEGGLMTGRQENRLTCVFGVTFLGKLNADGK
jgi:hypothetical protein